MIKKEKKIEDPEVEAEEGGERKRGGQEVGKEEREEIEVAWGERKKRLEKERTDWGDTKSQRTAKILVIM